MKNFNWNYVCAGISAIGLIDAVIMLIVDDGSPLAANLFAGGIAGLIGGIIGIILLGVIKSK